MTSFLKPENALKRAEGGLGINLTGRMLKRAFSKLKLEHVVIEKGQFHQDRTMPVATNELEVESYGRNLKKGRRNKCNWCQRSDSHNLIKCSNCQKEFFYMDCIKQRCCGLNMVSSQFLIMVAAVKKAYRKATLCVHPDKV
ncbi:hypothetical protein RJT34_11927 [Clitoria ternatea]|uniref:Uncharacterized protein n=1 Tax=Clitoria ternatea TaxID=43366 RepID=A0AAN9PK53_CLITE